MDQEKLGHLAYDIDETTNRFHYYENLWKRRGLDLLVRHLGRGRGHTLLDVGCGRGEMLAMASAAGFEVSGCDIDKECVRLGARFGSVWHIASEDDLSGVEARSYDAVSCMHVLEHVTCPRRMLRTVSRLSRRFVLIAVPNLRRLAYLRSVPRPSDLHVNLHHLQGWDHETLLNLAVNHCDLEFVQWAFDATMLPLASQCIEKLFGTRAVIRCETRCFRRLFPFHGVSCIGLFLTKQEDPSGPGTCDQCPG